MFGFLRPSCDSNTNRRYRQVYAAYCAFQRQQYGSLSSIFTSYEAVFLYHLAIESGACERPADGTPLCCRFRNDRENRWNIDPEIAQFCSAFAMVLAATKLEDDVRDGSSTVARFTEWTLRRSFQRARGVLAKFSSDLPQRLEQHIAQHVEIERRGKPVAIEEYVLPTARAFEDIFAAMSLVCTSRGIECNLAPIGKSLGAAIVAADCVFDFERDQRRGEFNPLRSLQSRRHAAEFARRELSAAGWRSLRPADETATATADSPQRSVAATVLRSAFHRIDIPTGDSPRSALGHATPTGWRRFAAARRGDCDCDCLGDCCAQGCTDCGGNLLQSFCCDNNGTNTCCDVSCCHSNAPCDILCCDCGPDCSSDKKKKKQQDDQPEQTVAGGQQPPPPPAASVGMFDGFGTVRIGERLLPARSDSAIPADSPVRVVHENWFGVIVSPQ